MEQVREDIAESRAHTDASLGAERANTDAAMDRAAARAQQVLDDLIEHDRMLADQRMLKFREGADSRLARERSASPAGNGAVAIERQAADEGKQVEREATDALLERERQLLDAVVEKNRGARETDHARVEARRQDTNDQLSTERNGADVALSTLDETKEALARARCEQARGGDVLAMVTHDLRSPLAVIAMSAQWIEGVTEGSTREAAQEVTRSAARMGRLVMDLLDVACIESGGPRIIKRPGDVGALVTEVLHLYRPLFADRGVTFAVEVPIAAVVASFDHDRIVQVLSNLLANAMKFTPPKGTISLHVEKRAQQVEFVLRDSGPGIHPDALPHVFKRFWQIDSDARRGLGLGLYICQHIVDAHGGRIWVESDFGKGATFRFTLPAS